MTTSLLPLHRSIFSKQSPCNHTIFFATPYSSALCFAHLSVLASFSMAKTCDQRPERARAMAFPPTPAKASMMMVDDFGADSAM